MHVGRADTTRGGRALVVGAGFIGTHVAQALATRSVETRVLNRSPLEGERLARLCGAEVMIGDASVRATLRRALDCVAQVYFCAGGLMPAESNLDPVADAALALPPVLNTLEELRDRPGVGLTYLSSGGTVYGPPAENPVREDHPTQPITSYGVMKLACEKYTAMYARLYGLRASVLRCSNVYGPHQPAGRGQGFIAAGLRALLDGERITLFGDGLNVRDYVFAPDVARVMLDLARHPAPPLVANVGSGSGTSLQELGRVDGARQRANARGGAPSRPGIRRARDRARRIGTARCDLLRTDPTRAGRSRELDALYRAGTP